MKYAVVMNTCMHMHPCATQSGELNGYLQGCFSEADTGTTVMIHDGSAGREQLLGYSPTARTVLLEVRQYQPEQILAALTGLEELSTAGIVLFYGDKAGSELAVRFAARTECGVLLDVTGFSLDGEDLLCRKRVYSGHLEGVFRLKRKPWCISVARGGAVPVPVDVSDGKRVVLAERAVSNLPHWVQSARFVPEERSGNLEHADFVIAVGRGLGSRERCMQVAAIANSLGAATGSSRMAAMEGWMPIDSIVGVSGAILRAAVSFSLGISGSSAYTAGIKGSNVVIAVNTDPAAPIVQQADVTVIADALQFMEALQRVMMEQDSYAR